MSPDDLTLRAAPAAVQPPKTAWAFRQDHDLPVLGVEQNPRVVVDWDPLLAAGVQPALVLGAERRWHGRR